MDLEAVQSRVAERNRSDLRDARLLIALGVPLAVVSGLVLTVLLFMCLMCLRIPLSHPALFYISLGTVGVSVLVDTWLHPSEHYLRARYYLVGGGESGPVFGLGWPVISSRLGLIGAAFSGVPLMTNMSDPRNLTMRGQAIANGCANVVLSGPRNIRKGMELLLVTRRRRRQATMACAVRFLEWLKVQGTATEAQVEELFGAQPHLVVGMMLADELGFLARRRQDGRKVIYLAGRRPA